MIRKLEALAATLAVAVAFSGAPSLSATPDESLGTLAGVTTIVGNKGLAMDVRLETPARVATPFGNSPDLKIKTTAAFTGGKMPNGKEGTTFLAPMPRYPLPGGGNYDFAKTYEDETILPAGNYRLYLLTDSPSLLRLRLGGPKGKSTLRPETPAAYQMAEPDPRLIGGGGATNNIYSATESGNLETRGLLFHALWLETRIHLSGQYFLCHRRGPPLAEPADSGPGCPFAEKSIANDRYTMLESDTKLLFQGYAGVPAGEHGLGTWMSTQSVVDDLRYMTIWLPYAS